MNFEKSKAQSLVPPSETAQSGVENKLSFEIQKRREGVMLYAFEGGVGVVINTTGENYAELPELLFGPYDARTGVGSLSQPTNADVSINMKYVAACIMEVVKNTGIHSFWFYPRDEDASNTENGDNERDEYLKQRKRRARVELFSRVVPPGAIAPAPTGHGYILTL